MQKHERIPVVIIGAGPAGLSAALFLARQGISPLLIERRPGTSIHPRARGLNVRTMEIYRSVGLEPAIEQAGKALAASKNMLFVETLAGQEIRRVPDDELVTTGEALAAFTPCNWVQCAQDELEPLLLEAAREAGAEVQFGRECMSLTQDEHGVTLEVRERATNTIQTLKAQYVIAADGARGASRKWLGVERLERAVQGYYVNIYFRADLRELVRGREFALCFVENPEAQGLILAVNNTDRWLFNAEYDPASSAVEDFTPERCLELVRAAVGIPDLEVEILSILPWAATAQYTTQMGVGRVFLMGDAAHTMPPAGGLGLNTGVADAHNLAWKLACVLKGEAGPALLESYEAERLPVARIAVEQAAAELNAERPDAPPEGGPDALLKPILGFSYRSNAVIADGTSTSDPLDLSGRPGTRLPHLWLERMGHTLSTLDLVTEKRFVLLTGAEGEAWRAEVQESVEYLQLPLGYYQIGGEKVRDLAGRWSEANGIGKTGALLVRPDGVVAWRAERRDDGSGQRLGEALRRILHTGG